MIRKLRISNFKSLRQQTELDLRPLTVIAGANSSGKSTALQPLLLLAQTFANRVGSDPIILNGPLLQLGTLSDIRSFGSEMSPITMGVDLKPPHLERQLQFMLTHDYRRVDNDFQQLKVDFAFDKNDSSIPPDSEGLHPILSSCNVIASYDEGTTEVEVVRGPQEPNVKEGALLWATSHVTRDTALDARRYRVTLDHASAESIADDLPAYEITGCLLRHGLPDQLIVSYNRREKIARGVAMALTRTNIIERGRFLRPSARWREYSSFILPPKVSEYLQEALRDKLPALTLPLSGEAPEKKAYSVSDWWAALGALPGREAVSLRTELAAMSTSVYEMLSAELPLIREEEATDLPRSTATAIATPYSWF
jgi:hypothetical protein